MKSILLDKHEFPMIINCSEWSPKNSLWVKFAWHAVKMILFFTNQLRERTRQRAREAHTSQMQDTRARGEVIHVNDWLSHKTRANLQWSALFILSARILCF